VLTLLFIVFIVLLLMGMDLFYAMGVASLVALLATSWSATPIPLTLIPQQLMAGVDSFPLLAVPMFLLAGELMSQGGMTARLVRFSAVLVGHIKGGLAQVSIMANMIMSGMSGSAVADAAATGSILIPAMVKRGYPPEFAAAVIASASTVGPIIPPSIPMVILGSMVSVSVGQLFIGGVVPGILMGLAMMFVVYRYAKRRDLPVEPQATLPEFWKSLWDSLFALLAPVIILGAIVSGIATPTEASVVAVVYSLIVGLFLYRELKWSELPKVFSDVAVTSAAVMVTVAAAQLFGWITTAEGLGTAIGRALTGVTTDPFTILLVINVVLLILGTVMEPIPIMLLTVPILYPLVTPLGIDPVHFGVMLILNLMIGCLTPPVGLNIFIASAISGVPVMRVANAAWGFIFILIVVLAVITYLPQTVLWLPNLFYK
jgi:tripartite ATP-independent transporter DctM subunit